MQRIIVTDDNRDWDFSVDGIDSITASEYMDSLLYARKGYVKVINLCRSYQYQSTGYYISLLAEARGHKVIPVASTMMDFRLPSLAREDAQDFDQIIQDTLGKTDQQDVCELQVYFGFTEDQGLQRIATLLFNLFQIPVLNATFQKKGKWQLLSLKPVYLKELSAHQWVLLKSSLQSFISGKQIVRKAYSRKKYDLAILIGQDDQTPPSDPKALQRFVKAAEKVGFNTEFITKSDFGKLTHFDALFIRETTKVNHHTFRFARRAEYEQLAVLDDPQSILKCTNKVYLQELLQTNGIATPLTRIVHKNCKNEVFDQFQYPFVIKQPDGAFSKGVFKVETPSELKTCLKSCFEETELIIAQEYMPTEFDWRVGVLNGEVLYVCRYYMARNHWQIVNWQEHATNRLGRSETILVEQAPAGLLGLALRAANLIGKGLYGVDIKEVNRKFHVIEINDNPSIDAGVEDKVEKGALYQKIMGHLMEEVKSK